MDFVLKSASVEISKKRKSLLSEINGDYFMERVFWNDEGNFVLINFLG